LEIPKGDMEKITAEELAPDGARHTESSANQELDKQEGKRQAKQDLEPESGSRLRLRSSYD
jgi:hypothetical protein